MRNEDRLIKLLSRRHFLELSGLTLGAFSIGGASCAALGRQGGTSAAETVNAMEPIAPVSVTTPSGIKVHGVQTGWICIKSNHYRMRGPESLKELNILTDTRWAEPKPILSWVIEHPEGLIVIDSSERAGARDLQTYLACADAGSRYFITRNFRVNVEPESELGPQLVKLGLSPVDVRWCVQTHLHFDHANGFDLLPQADVLVARAELEGHRAVPNGAVFCKYPSDFNPLALDYLHPYKGFSGHYPVTAAGDVVIVPTPGHSYGHQSVLLEGDNQTLFFAGDVTYDERQLLEGEVSGINVGVDATKASMRAARAYLTATPSVYLPSHDPKSSDRLRHLQVTNVEESHVKS